MVQKIVTSVIAALVIAIIAWVSNLALKGVVSDLKNTVESLVQSEFDKIPDKSAEIESLQSEVEKLKMSQFKGNDDQFRVVLSRREPYRSNCDNPPKGTEGTCLCPQGDLAIGIYHEDFKGDGTGAEQLKALECVSLKLDIQELGQSI